MTIAEQLTKLNDSKQAIKNAIEGKGVTVGNAPFAEYAGKITQISGGGGGAETRFGLSIGNFIGKLDANGELAAPTNIRDLQFDGVKTLAVQALYYVFYNNSGISSVLFPELTRADTSGMYSAFQGCTGNNTLDIPLLL